MAECPDPQGSAVTGVYRRPDGDYVTLEATPNARAVYERKGFEFQGYTPAVTDG
ncbi:MAG TPA: hypothetical protein VNM91_11820 [Dehalococcoidia bacterium]|nr:hypothetical protein [Dehalococcoidia bacterium]